MSVNAEADSVTLLFHDELVETNSFLCLDVQHLGKAMLSYSLAFLLVGILLSVILLCNLFSEIK